MKARPASTHALKMPKYSALALACAAALAALGWSTPSHAAAAAAANGSYVEFNRSMLAGGGSDATDLARFEHGVTVLPGSYSVDVYVNQTWKARTDVRFAAASDDTNAVPCVTTDLMNRMGLVPAKSATAAAAQLAAGTGCVQLADLIPSAQLDYDQSNLRLDASIPQAYSGQMPRGYVNPASWNQGVPAFLLNYNLNSYHTSSTGQNQTSTYLGLNAGLNLGPWHFRQNSTVTWQSGTAGQPSQRHWQNIAAYVRRDLPKLRSTLTIGDSYTDGAVFDSLSLRGVQLGTDDRMLPQSLQGYAPVIRGVADSNAKVTVSQNGVQIYQTTVAPGPFVISDLYPTGYGGDLVVTVTEADGRTHTFTVPYASVAQLLRPGITRFDIAAGQLRNTYGLDSKPGVIEGTIQHGFNNLLTGYAGFQGSEGYGAALVGAAFNTRFGALALDLTQAHASIPGYGSHNGQSFRITYSKIIPETKTSFTVAAYRYSTSGFLSLQNAEYARDYARRGLNTLQYLPSSIPLVNGVPDVSLLTPAQRAALAGTAYDQDNLFTPTGLLQQRDRFTLTTSQQLGARYGSLYANVSVNDYWNQHGRDTQFQFGYSNRFKRLSYNITLSRGRTGLGGYDNQAFFNASLPLGRGTHAPNLSVNVNHSDANGSQEQAMLSGTAGQWNQFTYGTAASHGAGTNGGAGNTFSVNAGYNSPYAILNASAGKGSGYSQESFGASGSLVAHQGGVTFGQPLGDTTAIVHVPGAAGAHILNAPGVRVDHFGYALVPYLAAYQLDTIQIDPQGLPLGVQLDATSANVAPYAGAVVMVDFKSHYGQALIARIHTADGKALPFGTEITDAKGQAMGTVGQGGLALLRVTSKSGELSASWQDAQGAAQDCAFAYAVPVSGKSAQAQAPIAVTCNAGHAVAPAQTEGAP
ncbi:MAG TPA: fimbria/pilus outer membrane usher protein [Rhodanobacteraceae bacterium]|jgi:outer membrane usher protein|nr:fimbria/pilus outer membrane usher protein [Rhodanobacteraceae bacterium]